MAKHAYKFVQIAVAGHNETLYTQSEWSLFGLDINGQVWMRTNRDAEWHRLDLPTEERR